MSIDKILEEIDLNQTPLDNSMESKKKKINGCKKGKNSERSLCHDLEDLFHGEVFRRTPGSGMFMGGFNFNRNSKINDGAKNTLTGDILVPDFFLFSIENKCYKDTPQFHNIVCGEDKEFNKWLGQASDDAIKVNKEFILFFRITLKRKAYVCLKKSVFDEFISQRNPKYPDNYLIYKNEFIIVEKKVFMSDYLSKYKTVNDRFFQNTNSTSI